MKLLTANGKLLIVGGKAIQMPDAAAAETAIENGTGYVYVPSALVDSYKITAPWSSMASKIRAIEDYPDITGG